MINSTETMATQTVTVDICGDENITAKLESSLTRKVWLGGNLTIDNPLEYWKS